MIIVHLFPTVIAQAHSPYSGDIKVVDGFGFRHLSTESIQQSGGIVKEIWSTALKSYAHKHKTWLILGVAGGSVIKLISQRYQPTKIVGIDIDPIIIDLGRRYFGLSKINNLQLNIIDAKDYLLTTDDYYDYILVDLFGHHSCPNFVYSPKFLNKLLLIGSHVFINHLYHTPTSIQQAHYLELVFRKNDITFSPRRILRNIVYHVAKT